MNTLNLVDGAIQPTVYPNNCCLCCLALAVLRDGDGTDERNEDIDITDMNIPSGKNITYIDCGCVV